MLRTDIFFFCLFEFSQETQQEEKCRALEELEQLKKELQNRVRQHEEKRFHLKRLSAQSIKI